uniref:DUF3996 domain-containing protein n=1 Tax=candidate division WOR-3 bacterium TaxID=2052148 RepID=A0A7C4TIM9_UNCW3
MNKKRLIISSLILLLSFCLGNSQHIGLGIILGSPTGFNGKLNLTRNSAVSANLGFSLAEPHWLHITCDYQFLFPSVIKWQDEIIGEQKVIEDLVPFLGVGGRFKLKEDEQKNSKLNIGLRLGGGIEYKIARFGIFLEIYPVVNIYPATEFDLEGGLGLRFYFQ